MNLNKVATKVINILIQSPAVSHIPDDYLNVTAVQELELTNAGLTIDGWRRITAPLVLYKYLIPISQKEFEKESEDFYERLFTALGFTQEKIKSLSSKETQEVLSNFSQQAKEMYGVDTSLIDSDNPLTDAELNTPIITNEMAERVIKSPSVGRYKLLKDLHKLQNKLQRGFEFKNLGKGNVIYKPETYELFIGVEKINIKPTSRTPTEHYILDHIYGFFSEEYFYSELATDIKEDGQPIRTAKQYKDSIDNLIEKIAIQTEGRITDFLITTTKGFQINPDYLEED